MALKVTAIRSLPTVVRRKLTGRRVWLYGDPRTEFEGGMP
jgi:hypothetical protein